MVLVALLVTAVAMFSLSLLSVLRSSQQENRSSRESLSALYACEAGLSSAVQELALGGDGNLGVENNPVDYGPSSYWVEASDIGNGRTSLVSYGRDDRSEMGAELVVQRSPGEYFRWAAFGEESLHMDSNSRTDSYDSTLPYAAQAVNGSGNQQHANEDGDVGSNGNITMDSNIGVWGDAHPGMTGTVDGTQAGDPNISGAVTPLQENLELPDIIMPVLSSSGDLLVDLSQTLTSGSYRFDNVQVNGNKQLIIVGPATVVCDSFRLQTGSSVIVDATDGPVDFYVINDFILNSNTQIASTTFSPLDVSFSLLSDNILDPGVDVDFDEDTLDFDSGSKLFGTIFAPSAQIGIDSNFELFGSLVARRVDLDSNSRVHYDEQLALVADDGKYVYQTLCWRLVPVP